MAFGFNVHVFVVFGSIDVWRAMRHTHFWTEVSRMSLADFAGARLESLREFTRDLTPCSAMLCSYSNSDFIAEKMGSASFSSHQEPVASF